ncbi:hypothetical protein RN001_002126 [Aquatica leii]|uniref:Histidine decarboxylase n=1 Tax=Aquatica leii TaxID=1421715 RepID=A0AAN7SSS3_9COLE|nr:hypothetical protein RN001_002126 [Aquatica leii]
MDSFRNTKMDVEEYRIRGKEMVDYIADYLKDIRSRRVLPDRMPGFLRSQIPENAPVEGESWLKIFPDVETIIMPSVTHWQSPHMHAYFPALNSYPSLLGDMLADAINCLGFTWASSPACTELEMIVMNWLGKMIGLPDDFLHTRNDSTGGGVIQTTSSEATLICLLAGRTQAFIKYQEIYPDLEDVEINGRLVGYCSDQAHSSVEKAALIGLVKMRYIESDENFSMRGLRLSQAIKKDREKGLIPFWVCATLGTTGGCAFDNLKEIGDVCAKEGIWLHVDAAYAGSAFICPEYRVWLTGIENADSIAFNPSKWLMHWQIPLSKRFRALKVWFVIRNFGIKGLQKHIREGVRLAEKFENLLLGDPRFEIPAKRHLGLVVFRLVGENSLTEKLLKRLNSRGNLHCVPAALKDKYVIRFTVTSQYTTIDDIVKDWKEIKIVTEHILRETEEEAMNQKAKVRLAETRERNENFGTSLLLANSPMSPKVVNGSFVAVYDQNDVSSECFATFAKLRESAQNSPSMRRRIRGILMSGKQFSLDSRLDLFHGIEEKQESRTISEPTTLPLLEDSNENDENSKHDNCTFQQNHLCVSLFSARHGRSRSVDHQTIAVMEDKSANTCEKCGHTLKSKKFEKILLSENQTFDDKWKLYSIKRCLYESDYYKVIKKKLRRAEDTSDLQSEADEVVATLSKRKTRPTQRLLEFDSSEEDTASKFSQPPTISLDRQLRNVASQQQLEVLEPVAQCSIPISRSSTPQSLFR